MPRRERFLWINITNEGSFSVLSSTSVLGLENLLKKWNFSVSHEEHFKHQDRFGTLFDGRQHVQYPVLFYEYIFELSPSPYKNESLGAVYMNSLAIHPHTNSFPSSIKILFLTPHLHK